MTFWKKARGDHILVTTITTSIGLTILFSETIFVEKRGMFWVFWYFFSCISGIFIPLSLIPNDWIDFEGTIPIHTFWKELFS
jgi:hypothetical protein